MVLLSISEAAKLLDISEANLRRLDTEGRLRAVRKGAEFFYELDEVREFQKKKANDSYSEHKKIFKNHTLEITEKWEKTGLLEGLSHQDRIAVAVMADNNSLMNDLMSDSPLSTQQIAWLTKESYLRCKLRKTVSVQPMLGPVALAFHTTKEDPDRITQTGVAAKTVKCNTRIFVDADFDVVKELYANAIAAELDMYIAERLPRININLLKDSSKSGNNLEYGTIYDYIAAPRGVFDDLNPDMFQGVDFFEISATLDKKNFDVVAVAGRYPESAFSPPVLMPYITLGQTGQHTKTVGLFMRMGWHDGKQTQQVDFGGDLIDVPQEAESNHQI